MKISELKEALEILKLLKDEGEVTSAEPTRNEILKPYLGKKVLIRAHRKGVNVGVVESTDDQFIYLQQSRKLWRWQAKEGIALESLAKFGIKEGTRATAICAKDALRLDDICGITVLEEPIWNEIMNWPISEQD